MIWTTRCCRTWRKENKILVSLKITHMIWHIRCFGKWKKGLFDFSNLKMRPFHFLTFQLFWFFSTFRNSIGSLSTFHLFDFSTFGNSFYIDILSDWTMQLIFPTQKNFPLHWGKNHGRTDEFRWIFPICRWEKFEAQQRQLLTGESGAGASQRCTARVQGQCFSLGIDDLMSTSLINILHTLDKNGSLYDPAGTESWNMQIRYETQKQTMPPTNNGSSPEWSPCHESTSQRIE